MTFRGRSGNDLFYGGSGTDVAYGFTGSDLLVGRGGEDRLFGATGADTLFGGGNADTLDGGFVGGSDSLFGGGGHDRGRFNLVGETGTLVFSLAGGGATSVATLQGSSGAVLVGIEEVSIGAAEANDTIHGNAGSDTIDGNSGTDSLYGGSGEDLLFGGIILDGDLIDGGSGVDTAVFSGGFNSGNVVFDLADGGTATVLQGGMTGHSLVSIEAAWFFGSEEDDTLGGGRGSDTFSGSSGADTLSGNRGDDKLYGAAGVDLLYGGSGNDLLRASATGDTLAGGSGTDTLGLFLPVAADTLIALGSAPSNSLQGIVYSGIEAFSLAVVGDSDVTIRGGASDDWVRSSRGNDTLVGFSGDDVLLAPEGINTIFGGSGFDQAYLRLATAVGDVTFSQSAFEGVTIFADGNRVVGVEHLEFHSGSGDDTLTGASGDDLFVAGGGDDTLRGRGGDDVLRVGNLGTAFGSDGDDRLDADVYNDGIYDDQEVRISLFGGDGDDALSSFNQTTNSRKTSLRLEGQSGDDRLQVVQTNLQYGTFDGGSGNDRMTLDARAIQGSFAELRAYGGAGDDTIDGKRFDAESIFSARLYGGGGRDLLFAQYQLLASGSANDVTLFGDGGADTLGAGQWDGRYFQPRVDLDLSFVGGAGADTIFGERSNGKSYMRGGSGRDTLFGGSGEDIFVVGTGELRTGEEILGGNGADTLFIAGGASAAALLSLSSVDTIFDMAPSSDDDHLFGNEKDNDLRGAGGDDFLYGLSGSDGLRGQDGDDRLYDGSGGSTLFGQSGDDRAEAGDGDDRLGGGSGSDLLFGGSGQDFFNGGSGADTAVGGRGNDTFVVDTASDRVREKGEGGSDLVRSDAVVFSLGSGFDGFVERVILNRSAGQATAYGSDHDNTLLGNSLVNLLVGHEGDDILNGRGGNDTAVGGLGDDTFVVDTSADVVQELSGGGLDLVRAERDFSLPDGTATAFIENLRMQAGKGNINGTGNSLDNTIEGNTGANRLAGNQGADHLLGGRGADTLFGGNGGDRMEGEGGADTLNLGAFDTAFGGSGGDAFRFSSPSLAATGTGGPVIADFDGEVMGKGNGADKLVFATGLEVGVFSYIESAAFSGGGSSEARFAGAERVEVDRDGNGSTDIVFQVQGLTSGNQLTGSDFIWV